MLPFLGKKLVAALALAAVLVVGIRGVSACEPCSYRVVTVYEKVCVPETRTIPYTCTVVRYDECSRPYTVEVTRYRIEKVTVMKYIPVKKYVPVYE